MKEKELQKRVQALAAQAGEMGLFVDVFFTRIYSNGQAGTSHAACNHDQIAAYKGRPVLLCADA